MKTKLALITIACTVVVLGLPEAANAQCTAFGLQLLADGRPTTITIPFNGSGTFVRGVFFRAAPGRSYSVEVFTPEFLLTSIGEVFLGAANDTSCPLTNGPGVRDIRDVEPRASGIHARFSLTVTAPITNETTPSFFIRMRNFSTTTADTITVTVTETTLFNPAWSTFGTFETFYSCINTTNGTLNATLKLFTINGVEVGSFNFSNVATGTGVSTNTGALSVANNQNGYATLTHDGPPGAFLCEAAIADFATAPRIVQPVKFEPARQMR